MISNHTTINVEKKTKGKQNVNITINSIQWNIDFVTFLHIYHLS